MDANALESTISGLIEKYPVRWSQAVANPNLRGWFVAQAMRATGGSAAIERAIASKIIDRLAHGQ